MLWTLLTHRLLQGGSRSINKLVIDSVEIATKTRHIASSGEDLMLWTLLTHRLLQGGSRSIHKLVIDFLLERILKVLGKILGRLGGQRKRNRATRDQKGKNNKNETSPNSTSDESETDKNETGRGTR